jgi:immune inhibitor A
MNKLMAALAAVGLAAIVASGSAMAAEPKPMPGGHVLPNPLAEKQEAGIQKALQLQLRGKIAKGAKSAKIEKRYVPLAREGTGRLFVILAQFGSQTDPVWGGPAGPAHNEMTPPDRGVDNTTIWYDSYEPPHYYDLYFDASPGANSVTNYYNLLSCGRYGFEGNVTDWVNVAYNEARYGTNDCNRNGTTTDPVDSTVCSTVWALLRDAADQWVLDQLASGKSMDDIKAYLATYDVEDRYDYNGNGNFNEADGYIDHFQLIHAGADEAVGGGAEGTNAIWSHRWYSYQQYIGTRGPNAPDGQNLLGGFEIGASVGHPTGYWVGDYVMEPENAGVGVIAHETGHDYGLPDEYDTGYTGEASSAFWTIMSSGSYGNDNTNGIGNRPVDFNAWDKFQLGWLNYAVVDPAADAKTNLTLGPEEFNTNDPQGAFVILPNKSVTTELGAPYAGSKYYYSGSGDNLDNLMYKQVNLPASSSLTAKVRYDIEPDWDYAYVVVSTDGGTHWTGVPTNVSSSTSPNGQNFGNGITGSSGGNWVDLTADLSGYSGNVLIGFRYWTDGAATYPGFSADEVSIAGGAADGAESDGGWTFDPADGGFRVTTGTDTRDYANYYVLENRQYAGYDTGLQYAYNFGGNIGPDWADRFAYQDGLLVSYWDTSQTDNNVGEHPGHGLILPVDVHTGIVKNPDGTDARTRIQVFDATLSTQRTDKITLHQGGTPFTFGGEKGIDTFDDRGDYTKPYVADGHHDGGSDLPHTGTVVTLKSVSGHGAARVTVESANGGKQKQK